MKQPEQNQRWVAHKDVEGDFPAPGLERRTLAYCAEMMCVENRFEKGAVGAMHSHPHTQITYVAQGEFSFTIDGETRTVGQGDTLLKQDGVPHGCVCLEPGILVDFFHPMREDFIENQ